MHVDTLTEGHAVDRMALAHKKLDQANEVNHRQVDSIRSRIYDNECCTSRTKQITWPDVFGNNKECL